MQNRSWKTSIFKFFVVFSVLFFLLKEQNHASTSFDTYDFSTKNYTSVVVENNAIEKLPYYLGDDPVRPERTPPYPLVQKKSTLEHILFISRLCFSAVHHRAIIPRPEMKIVLIMHKKNISHLSPDDDPAQISG